MRNAVSLLFAGGLAFLLFVIVLQIGFGAPPMVVGEGILADAPERLGSANIVTAVVLGYRGIDTLGELSILFAAATAAGLVLGRRRADAPRDASGGFILAAGAELLFPLLLVVGFYVILHGHLTPGGGFQGGVLLAAAFFLAVLADPARGFNQVAVMFVEGAAGSGFILVGLWALADDGAFLQPLLEHGVIGELVSAGTLPVLYFAVGLKVGAELAGLLVHLSDAEAADG